MTKKSLGKLFSSEQYQECFDLAVNNLQQNKNDFNAMCYKGACSLKLGYPNEAVEILTECLEKEQGHAFLWVFRGDCHYALKDYSRAFSDYWASLGLDPENGAVADKCARTLYFLGDFDYALKYMQQAIQLKKSPEPFLVMIVMLRQNGHPLWADEVARLGLQIFPDEKRFEKYAQGLY